MKVTVLYALGVIVFAVGLLASIALHEIGHLVPAKRFGVKVTQYMVGFGPTVWSRRRGETEYGLKAIPLGGYIKMIGMIPPRVEGKRSRWPRRLAALAEDFRNASRADVRPGDEPREFYRLTPWKKIVVMVGGPSMNFVIYIVLTILLLGAVGLKEPTNRVQAVSKCVVSATADVPDDGSCPAGAPAAPAAGVLEPGDRIVAIDGRPMSDWDASVSVIERSAGQRITITVERDGSRQDLALTPVPNTKYVDATSDRTHTAGFIGITTVQEYQRVGLTALPGQVGGQIGQAAAALGHLPSKIGNLFGTVFEGQKRDPNGAVGVVGLGRIGGEVASSSNIDLLDKIYFLLSLLAGVNLLLFFFNLIPLLPLDGGHVAGAVVEAIKRRLAAARAPTPPVSQSPTAAGVRTRARPAIYVDTAQMVPVLYAVAAILFAFTLLVVYADLVKPITLNG